MNFVSSSEKAKEWGISQRRVAILCKDCLLYTSYAASQRAVLNISVVADEDCEIILLNVKRLLITCPTACEPVSYTHLDVYKRQGQYVAKIVMNNIIQALAKPENAAMVSIFVPGELLTAAGLTPVSYTHLN